MPSTSPTASITKYLNSTIVVRVSADLYLGGPQFQLLVDGKPVGAVQTVDAVHSKGAWQEFTFSGDFGSTGPGKVEIAYLNDRSDPAGGAGRNLYVDKITVNGVVHQAEHDGFYDRVVGTDLRGTEAMYWAGKMSFATAGSVPPPAPSTTISRSAPTPAPTPVSVADDTIVVRVSGDRGPEFQLLVDGKPVGAVQSVQAVHGSGQWQDVTFKVDLTDGSHKIAIAYSNDQFAAGDRNLYVDRITVNGTVYESEKVGFYDRDTGYDHGGTEAMYYNGKMVFDVVGGTSAQTSAPTPTPPPAYSNPTPAPTQSDDPHPAPTPAPSPGFISGATQVIQLKAGCTQADIQSAINGAKDGATIILPKDATIMIASTLHIDVSQRGLTLDLNGTTLKQAGNCSVLEAHGSHPWTKSVSITTQGDTTTLKFATAPTDLKPGDWIKVVADDSLPNATDAVSDVRVGQAMQVASINAGTVVLEGKLLYSDLYLHNVRASKYSSGDLVIENGHIQGDQSQALWKSPLVCVGNAIAPVLDHLQVTDGNSMGFNIADSIHALVANADVRNLKDNTANGNYGYGVHSSSSLGTIVVGLHADTVRHATDSNTPTVATNSSDVGRYGADIGMTVTDSVAYNTTAAAWSWHSEERYGVFNNVQAFDSYQFAVTRGLNGTMVDSVGVNLTKGIQVYEYADGDGRYMTFDNVHLREVDNNAIWQSNTVSDIKVTDSTFEVYGALGGLPATVATMTHSVITSAKGDADSMTGTADRDLLYGGAAADTINGSGGDDIIWGGAGADRLTGGAGSDRFYYNQAVEAGDVITDFTVGASGDVLDVGILLARIGYHGSDPIKDGYIHLAQSGADTLLQFDSNGGGNSYLTLATLSNVKVSSLTADNLDLSGVSPGNQIIGGPGSDRLVGGHSGDYFKGSGGADTFAISGSSTGHDTIVDFAVGQDHLEISRNIGGNGITTAAQVLSHAHTDMFGNTTFDLSNGNTITLLGVSETEIAATSIVMTS